MLLYAKYKTAGLVVSHETMFLFLSLSLSLYIYIYIYIYNIPAIKALGLVVSEIRRL